MTDYKNTLNLPKTEFPMKDYKNGKKIMYMIKYSSLEMDVLNTFCMTALLMLMVIFI